MRHCNKRNQDEGVRTKNAPVRRKHALAAMKKEGISDADIDMMLRKNPARLLGLDGLGDRST